MIGDAPGSPGEFDVQIADAAATPWPDGCAGLVISTFPPSPRDRHGHKRWIGRIDAIVAEAARLLEHGGRFAALLLPSAESPSVGNGSNLLLPFKSSGLLPLGRFTFASYLTPQQPPEDKNGPRHTSGPPRSPLQAHLILGERCAHARCTSSYGGIQRGLRGLYSINPEPWRRYIGATLSRLLNESSDGAISPEAASWLISRHSYEDAIVVCLTGEARAATVAVSDCRRCLLAVPNELEMATAAHQLADALRRRDDAKDS